MIFVHLENGIKSLVVLLLASINSMASGQISVSQTESTEQSIMGQQCYCIVLVNQGKNDILLVGQNYRLYYDSEITILSDALLQTLLDTLYISMNPGKHYFDVDASGFGVLPFDTHVGFRNIAKDLKLSPSGGVSIPVGKNQSVASMCFEVQEGKTPIVTWAKGHLIHTYAITFVEMAIVEGDQLKKVKIAEYRITQSENANTQQADVSNRNYFPNLFTDDLNITFNESLTSEATVMVEDVFGQEITSNMVQKGSTEYKLQEEGLPNGAMYIEIKTLDGQISVMKTSKIQ
jgi:hypothetical protein